MVAESQIVKTISDAGYNFDEAELSEKFNYTITKKEPLKLTPVNPLEQPKPGENPEEIPEEIKQ
jgi:hypothetical protein